MWLLSIKLTTFFNPTLPAQAAPHVFLAGAALRLQVMHSSTTHFQLLFPPAQLFWPTNFMYRAPVNVTIHLH